MQTWKYTELPSPTERRTRACTNIVSKMAPRAQTPRPSSNFCAKACGPGRTDQDDHGDPHRRNRLPARKRRNVWASIARVAEAPHSLCISRRRFCTPRSFEITLFRYGDHPDLRLEPGARWQPSGYSMSRTRRRARISHTRAHRSVGSSAFIRPQALRQGSALPQGDGAEGSVCGGPFLPATNSN